MILEGAVLLRYLPAILAAVGLLLFGIYIGGLAPKAELAQEKQERAEDKRQWEAASRIAAERSLKKQQDLQLQADTAREDLSNALQRIKDQDARIARLAVDAGSLRDKLAAYASGAGSADSLATCQSRAAALANLLAEGGGLLVSGANLSREAAIAHDERAAEVAALLQAWPRNAETRSP